MVSWLGLWFEKHCPDNYQVVVGGCFYLFSILIFFFFSEGNSCSLSGRWRLFLESNLVFSVFQLNNYAYIYYYNVMGLPTTNPQLLNFQPCAKKACKYEIWSSCNMRFSERIRPVLVFCTEVKFQQITPALNSSAIVQDVAFLISRMRFLWTFQDGFTKSLSLCHRKPWANNFVFMKRFWKQDLTYLNSFLLFKKQILLKEACKFLIGENKSSLHSSGDLGWQWHTSFFYTSILLNFCQYSGDDEAN